MRWPVSLLALAVASAQAFVVDAANGPGTHFTDLATAVAAVPDGAVLQVRAGGYPSFAITGKSLTIVGEANAHLAGATGVSVTIQALAVGQRALMRNLAAVVLGGVRSTCTCQNCAGEIVLDQVGGLGPFESQLIVSQCAQVVVTRSAFACNAPGAAMNGSDVTFVDCSLASGHNAVPGATLTQHRPSCRPAAACS